MNQPPTAPNREPENAAGQDRLEHYDDGSKVAVWCYCYATPEPDGPWVFPDDEHADTCGIEHATGVRPDPKKAL